MRKLIRERKSVLVIGCTFIILLAAMFSYIYYQKQSNWSVYEIIANAEEKFKEQKAFAYTKTIIQQKKTPQNEILTGGIYESYSIQKAKDESFKVDYVDGILENDDTTVKKIDKATFYLTSNSKGFTDNSNYSFKISDLRINQNELHQYVSFIAEEFKTAEKGQNRQAQEILEGHEDGEYIITYKVRLNEMSNAVSEYIIHVNEETKEFSKVIVKEHFEGFAVTEKYVIDEKYVATDTITIPGKTEEIND